MKGLLAFRLNFVNFGHARVLRNVRTLIRHIYSNVHSTSTYVHSSARVELVMRTQAYFELC